MARCKSSPEVVRTKCELAHRLKEIRTEQYGERGGPELARRLNLPIRTWYNYETGVTVPSEVLLRFIELTEVEPLWLLHGQGSKFRRVRPMPGADAPPAPPGSVPDLLRRALSMLEQGDGLDDPGGVIFPPASGPDPDADQVVVRVEDPDAEAGRPGDLDFVTMPLKREWLAGIRHFRCIRVRGDAMVPILADGAVVGVSEQSEEPEALNGALVAARVGGRTVVRWFQLAGQVALLRAEDPSFEPDVVPVAPEDPADAVEFRRILWSSTPHASAHSPAQLS
ncbi:LexA family transcriptional regulator [Tautonia plasticadhaerens]|uniref:LexA repressor n=1 Tax=Tautonia plasticadhaerens TaxID=2527974 RepID=A0A518HAX5_9BACT|nr:XRE family transcriptional regulator [Tautonia plasticadhaerens]QDV38010.1 LexA repressor [Tautonia plasticadhaerens]